MQRSPQPRCKNSINSNLPAPALLPEPYFGQCGVSAPEGGTYSRVGACPYLLDLIYEPRPCKGLISRILLRGKPRQRYAPLTGAAARVDELRREIGASPYPKYEPLSGAAARTRAAQQFVNSLNSLLRRLRPTSNCSAARNPVVKIRLIRICRRQRSCLNHISDNAASAPLKGAHIPG